jgi:hypothetical protein
MKTRRNNKNELEGLQKVSFPIIILVKRNSGVVAEIFNKHNLLDERKRNYQKEYSPSAANGIRS